MAETQQDRHDLHSPDGPDTAAASTPDGERDRKSAAKDKSRADDLAAKVAVGDELSGYEKVAGRGLPDA